MYKLEDNEESFVIASARNQTCYDKVNNLQRFISTMYGENLLDNKMYDNLLFFPSFIFPPKKRGKKKWRMN